MYLPIPTFSKHSRNNDFFLKLCTHILQESIRKCEIIQIFFHIEIYNSKTILKNHQRIDAFELWFWRRLLRAPWNARRSNQSILKEISPEYSSEGLMLKLKLQSFGHLMRTADTLEKTLMLGKIEGGRRRGLQDEMVGWHH